MIKSTFLIAASLLLFACGDSADDAAPEPQAVVSDDADEAYYDDFGDDEDSDSLADDPEYGEFVANVEGDSQSMRADCIVLFDRIGEQLENSSLTATFGIIKFTDDSASDWWSGEAMIRASHSPQDGIDAVAGQYEVPASEDAETDDADFWMSMNEEPGSAVLEMTLEGQPFDYKTDAIEKDDTSQRQLKEVTMRWRGPMQGVLADGEDRVGQVELNYSGLCQFN